MKRGFTLIELIFVIVIIGVLSAVAVPKFKNLKQNAEASSVLKVANDAYASVPAAYVNKVDMEDGKVASISDVVKTQGKGWKTDGNSTYFETTEGNVSVVTLESNSTDRNVTITIDCSKFTDDTTEAKCTKLNGGSTTSTETTDF